ncbi:MAG TPA: protein kinase [Candidatus Hydrogenedentes bacterium]|nr:protein kinase [Candidatus Hydrogenedentota bacterium]
MSSGTSSARETYVFGKYEILDTAGSGGMGVVYRAVDRALGRTVALKVLRDDLRNQPHLVARFQREAKAFAALDHPNIVRIYSVGLIGRIPYIAMEHIPGEPLSEILLDRGPISWGEALMMGAEVADALACAHDSGIIHRDIKPGNILIDSEGHAHVTDFGIAKILSETTQLTVDGARLGTPQYLCPERCQNKEITPSSDIYSLGVVLFQCISGRLPYESASTADLIQRIAAEPPARLRQFVPDVPDAVERLIAHMIEKKPADRPKDARTLRMLIDRVRDGKPLDEHAEEMAAALASFRKSLPSTPAHGVRPDATTEKVPRLGKGGKQIWAWRQSHFIALAFVLVTAAVLVCGGLVYSSFMEKWMLKTGFDVTRLDTSPEQHLDRWTSVQPVAVFSEETPGVYLARLNLKEFTIGGIHWARTSGEVVVGLQGVSGSSREGQYSVCRVDVEKQEGAVLLSPTFSLISVSGTVAANSGIPRYLMQTEHGLMLGSLSPLEKMRVPALEHAVSVVGIQGDGSGIAYARQEGRGWSIVERSLADASERILAANLQERVDSMVYSMDGNRLVWICRGNEKTSTLWMLERNSTGPASILAEGNLSFSSGAFHPDGQSLVIESEGVLQQIQASNGQLMREFGRGRSAAWHPSGKYVVTVSEDRAGRAQLWTVPLESQDPPVQLTYLGSGTTGNIEISPRGDYAMSIEAQGAALVVVRLAH